MTIGADCPECSARLPVRTGSGCRECGWTPAGQRAATTIPRSCFVDGGELRADGWCERGQGFPITMAAQAVVCPACRRPLAWDGGCGDCRTWPGDRYEYWPPVGTGRHYRMAAKGPGQTATAAEAASALAELRETAAKIARA